MAGTGRLILAAATGEQEAWEDPHLGHGLLTYHLLRALLGAAAGDGTLATCAKTGVWRKKAAAMQPAARRDVRETGLIRGFLGPFIEY